MLFSENTAEGVINKEQIYQAIFEMAADAITLIDADTLTFVRINQAASQLFAYSDNELINKPVSLIFEGAGFESENITEPLKRQQTVFLEKKYRPKNGKLRDAQIHSRLIAIGDRNFIIAIWRDITCSVKQQHLLQESEARFRYFIENNQAIMLLIDPVNGVIEDANQAAVRFYGYDQLVGMNIKQINTLSSDFVDDLKKTAAESISGSRFVAPHRLQSGEIRHVEVHTTPISFQQQRLLFSIIYDITEQYEARKALEESESAFRRLFDEASNPIMLFDPESGEVIDCNQAVVRFLHFRHKHELIGYSPSRFIAPIRPDGTLALPIIQKNIEKALDQGSAFFDCCPVTRDGQRLDVEISLTALVYHGKKILHALWIDISARKASENRLKLAASVFSNANEAIAITDAQGKVIDVNHAFTRMTGFAKTDIKGNKISQIKSDKHNKYFYKDLWRSLFKTGQWQGEIWNKHKTGKLIACLVNISAVYDEQDKIQHFVSLMTDITLIKQHQKQLEYQASHDTLTKLPNRLLLHDRLQQAMRQVHRYNQQLAVIYLDLDSFKEVNDLYGHDAGDYLLIATSRRIQKILRESDTLARLGGDEFVLVLPDLTAGEDCNDFISRLLKCLTTPVNYDDHKLKVSASLGVCFYPQPDNIEAEQLLRQADQAMYQAKLAGKNQYHVFDPEHDRYLRQRHRNLLEIKQALGQNEFVLYYQPKVNILTGEVIGVEALIRWLHPVQGLLPPAAFIPLIENHSLSRDLDLWVINQALMQLKCWQDQGLMLPVSVNLGGQQLQNEEFPELLQNQLSQFPEIRPGQLILEILETSALDDIEMVSENIAVCQRKGFKFSLDDFGTGYSSLTYLKRLRVNQLKIDQSFVRNLLHDEEDQAILKMIVGFANTFKYDVIAEGVETEFHGLQLLKLGCHLAQGYGIAKPMPAEEIPEWVLHWKPYQSWREHAK